MQVRFISNITKDYGDMYRIMIYKSPKACIVGEGNIKDSTKKLNADYIPADSSIRRTRQTIKDYVLCNDFDLFCTFTFDPDKVDSFNYSLCQFRMQTWFKHQKAKNRDLKYLLIPEQHKSGRWHFHALTSGLNAKLHDSHHKSDSGRTVYNIKSYRGGFSTAVKIDNKESVSSYVTKYITKDLIRSFNQKRFACSQNLNKPVKTINGEIYRSAPPLFRQHIYANRDYDIYEIPHI